MSIAYSISIELTPNDHEPVLWSFCLTVGQHTENIPMVRESSQPVRTASFATILQHTTKEIQENVENPNLKPVSY